ncbi:alpha/beta hydrolase (plasmid) [Glutamicibacter bergerei]
MLSNLHSALPGTAWGSETHEARTAVIAVHGRGQSPAFMQEQASRIDAPAVRFYAPAAPNQSWYPKQFLEALADNEPDLSLSLDTLGRLVDAVEAEGFARERIVLWGFSQGACLISHLILTRPDRLGGLALLTGGYIGPDALGAPEGLPLDGMPVVVRSIDQDPWVPRDRVEQTAQTLSAAGASVDLLVAAGNEHIITDEAMSAVGRLLSSI